MEIFWIILMTNPYKNYLKYYWMFSIRKIISIFKYYICIIMKNKYINLSYAFYFYIVSKNICIRTILDVNLKIQNPDL